MRLFCNVNALVAMFIMVTSCPSTAPAISEGVAVILIGTEGLTVISARFVSIAVVAATDPVSPEEMTGVSELLDTSRQIFDPRCAKVMFSPGLSTTEGVLSLRGGPAIKVIASTAFVLKNVAL